MSTRQRLLAFRRVTRIRTHQQRPVRQQDALMIVVMPSNHEPAGIATAARTRFPGPPRSAEKAFSPRRIQLQLRKDYDSSRLSLANGTVAVGEKGSGFIETDSKATARVEGDASVKRIGDLAP